MSEGKSGIAVLFLCLFISTAGRADPPTSQPVARGKVCDDSAPYPAHRTPFVPSFHPMNFLPSGIVLDSTYFDWQANGSMGRRIWTNGDGSVHVTFMRSVLEEFDDRGMCYYYAGGPGEPFVSHGNVGSFRNGYGSISAYPATTPDVGTIAVISSHDYSTSSSAAFVDSLQGMGRFSPLSVHDTLEVLWPRPTVNSDGSIVLIGTAPGVIAGVDCH